MGRYIDLNFTAVFFLLLVLFSVLFYFLPLYLLNGNGSFVQPYYAQELYHPLFSKIFPAEVFSPGSPIDYTEIFIDYFYYLVGYILLLSVFLAKAYAEGILKKNVPKLVVIIFVLGLMFIFGGNLMWSDPVYTLGLMIIAAGIIFVPVALILLWLLKVSLWTDRAKVNSIFIIAIILLVFSWINVNDVKWGQEFISYGYDEKNGEWNGLLRYVPNYKQMSFEEKFNALDSLSEDALCGDLLSFIKKDTCNTFTFPAARLATKSLVLSRPEYIPTSIASCALADTLSGMIPDRYLAEDKAECQLKAAQTPDDCNAIKLDEYQEAVGLVGRCYEKVGILLKDVSACDGILTHGWSDRESESSLRYCKSDVLNYFKNNQVRVDSPKPHSRVDLNKPLVIIVRAKEDFGLGGEFPIEATYVLDGVKTVISSAVALCDKAEKGCNDQTGGMVNFKATLDLSRSPVCSVILELYIYNRLTKTEPLYTLPIKLYGNHNCP